MQVSLYYSFKNLQDTLIGYVQDQSKITTNKQVGDVIYFYDENQQIVSFNILNVSQKEDLKNTIHNEGLIFLNPELKKVLLQNYLLEVNQLSSAYVVGKVVEVNKVEKTHLNHCLVDINQDEPLSIVCGGTNVSQGIKVVVVQVGGFINTGKHIVKSELFNKPSCGMICSEAELGLKKHDPKDHRILILNDDMVVGSEFYLKTSKDEQLNVKY
ncbi:YtpR family tRNA-binding protein [Mycoplasma sp. E35C]|uniref:YtpR family tRNA-binding protein n=1 Tax=Mycoplasma sp. E35C TaxID=2801918 RepID=UPI001CA3B9C6|nr:DUF4479 domain-containing protein [Mycoplasma sp. E35C]QZX49338.1 DUF4479 domain-containing protein [Mycoplasma sp. E35C]